MTNSVDIVYKTVLSILNKEQRGYMTPSEFNNIARQVQLELFEKNFESLNLALRMPENDNEYANREKLYEENISAFEVSSTLDTVLGNYNNLVYRLGSLTTNYLGVERNIEQVSTKELKLIQKSKLTKPNFEFPVFVLQRSGNDVGALIFPNIPGNQITVNYITFPTEPQWNFTVGNLGQYLYSQGTSIDFSISANYFTDIVLNILMYAGVIIRDQQIIQAAANQIAQEDAVKKS